MPSFPVKLLVFNSFSYPHPLVSSQIQKEKKVSFIFIVLYYFHFMIIVLDQENEVVNKSQVIFVCHCH